MIQKKDTEGPMNQLIFPILLAYLIIMNLAAFTAMGLDKRRAKLHKWRIPEKTLLLLAFLGGSLGGILGMAVFRHKTKHLSFTLTLPLFFLLHIAGILWYILR
jgi:uncharacterized membrane protein YsdA (DUF1294 family)